VRDEDVAKDVLQDALWIICRKLSRLRDPRWVRAWAYRIATREAVHRGQRESLRVDVLSTDALETDRSMPDEGVSPDQDVLAALPDLLANVSPASAIVLRMHYLDGLTHAEIAEALEIPEGTVKSRLGYGLTLLRRHLGVTSVRTLRE
jgi:RNA polymerase sigma-70 factor, ECF subfamily